MIVEFFLLIDENENWVLAQEESDLTEKYDDEVGESSGLARRIIKVELDIAAPTPFLLKGTVPGPQEEATLVAVSPAA